MTSSREFSFLQCALMTSSREFSFLHSDLKELVMLHHARAHARQNARPPQRLSCQQYGERQFTCSSRRTRRSSSSTCTCNIPSRTRCFCPRHTFSGSRGSRSRNRTYRTSCSRNYHTCRPFCLCAALYPLLVFLFSFFLFLSFFGFVSLN